MVGINQEEICLKAIELAGGCSEVAREVGVERTSPAHWKRIPPHHALKVAELSGLTVFDLRPDIFGTPERMAEQVKQKTTPARTRRRG